uniref:Uncharacterized protein n=1 Tax=Oryza punctata TaxID=4537 RepID=A0A0E0M7F8_ORYPU
MAPGPGEFNYLLLLGLAIIQILFLDLHILFPLLKDGFLTIYHFYLRGIPTWQLMVKNGVEPTGGTSPNAPARCYHVGITPHSWEAEVEAWALVAVNENDASCVLGDNGDEARDGVGLDRTSAEGWDERSGGRGDGATAEDPIFGTKVPVTENHGVDQVQEDIDIPVESNDVDTMQEDLLNEIYNKAADVIHGGYNHFNLAYLSTGYTTEESVTLQEPQISAVGGRAEETTPAMAPKEAKTQDDPPREAQDQPGKIQLTEEQRARMEANRLRALERAAAARSRASQPA